MRTLHLRIVSDFSSLRKSTWQTSWEEGPCFDSWFPFIILGFVDSVWKGRTSWRQECLAEAVHLPAARNQRKENKGKDWGAGATNGKPLRYLLPLPSSYGLQFLLLLKIVTPAKDLAQSKCTLCGISHIKTVLIIPSHHFYTNVTSRYFRSTISFNPPDESYDWDTYYLQIASEEAEVEKQVTWFSVGW